MAGLVAPFAKKRRLQPKPQPLMSGLNVAPEGLAGIQTLVGGHPGSTPTLLARAAEVIE